MRTWLIKLRKENMYTQQEVASKVHIDRAYYAQIENGTRNPSIFVAKQIADFFHIHPSVFFTEHISDPFQTALLSSPVVLAHCGTDLRYTWVFNAPTRYSENSLLGKRDDELYSSEGTVALMEMKREVIKEGKPLRRTIRFPLPEGSIIYDIFAQPIYDEEGNITGAATCATKLS